MKKIITSILMLLMLNPVFAESNMTDNTIPATKIYVALEKEGKIAVINGDTQEVMKTVDLSMNENGVAIPYMAHNIQVSPDGKTVWATANAGMDDDHAPAVVNTMSGNSMSGTQNMDMKTMTMSGMNEHHTTPETMPANDEAIILSTETDSIIKRIPLATKAHLAHVVLTPDNTYAYVSGQETNMVYKIDTTTFATTKIDLGGKSGPHGLRIDPAGKKAYIALMAGKGLGILDIATDTVKTIPLDGAAVQTAILPNGKWVFVSLYDTKKLAAYNTQTEELIYVELPKTSQGPVQLYPAPDGSALYVADQGSLYGRPVNNRVYKLDFVAHKIRTIMVGNAPHGVTVSRDGKWAYVTNLQGKSVSVIDTKTNKEVKRIEVGEEPNGISEWVRK